MYETFVIGDNPTSSTNGGGITIDLSPTRGRCGKMDKDMKQFVKYRKLSCILEITFLALLCIYMITLINRK